MNVATSPQPGRMRRSVRAVVAVALAVGVTLSIAGCAAGRDATTNRAHSLGEGVDASSGPIRVANALVMVPPAPTALPAPSLPTTSPTSPSISTSASPTTSPSDQALPAAQPAYLSMQISNSSQAAVELRGVSVVGSGPVTVQGATSVPAGGVLTLGAAGSSTTQVSLPGFTGKAGQIVTLSLGFSDGSQISNLHTVAVAPPGAGSTTSTSAQLPAPR